MAEPGNSPDLDVLVVGAGPTGLALAAQLRMFGARFRIIDRLRDRTRGSRALAVQARTLELLQTIGVAQALVARGNPSTELVLHVDARRVTRVVLGETASPDTRFPFILFVSQADTEALIGEHLESRGVTIERGVELVTFQSDAERVRCVLRHDDGRHEVVAAAFVVGCDGAHSTLRKGAAIAFEGGSYPQEFVLGDVEADGRLEPHAINAFAGPGVAMFFPLGRPTTWRVIAMSAERAPREPATRRLGDGPTVMTRELSVEELQRIVDEPTARSVRVRDPAWLTRFRLHHRQTARYRAGRVFLAGDAAHVHSPVGGQGMNTGVQDAWNLGWKLAFATRGLASPCLLDSYEAERWPVGRFLLRYTDRIFAIFTRAASAGKAAAWIRRAAIPRVMPLVLRSEWIRRVAFRFVSELDIHYRGGPAVTEGAPRLRGGPRAGDRFPDARVMLDGRDVWLQEALGGPHYSLVLCGNRDDWNPQRVASLLERFEPVLRIHYLARRASPGTFADEGGAVLARLGVDDAAQYLLRPDGYIAFRCAGTDLAGASAFLAECSCR